MRRFIQPILLPLLGVLALASDGPMAQARIRIEPETVVFEGAPNYPRTRRRDVTIWVDNIPEPGLRRFKLVIDADPRDTAGGGAPCIWFESATVDPNLDVVWDRAGSLTTTEELRTVVTWYGWAYGLYPSFPTGSIRLGHLTFLGRGSDCVPGDEPESAMDPRSRQGEFWIDLSFTRWTDRDNLTHQFADGRGGPWIWTEQPDLDLAADCTLLSPVGDFVDGDLVHLSCLVSNLGSFQPLVEPVLRSAFSADDIVDPGDPEITRSIAAGRPNAYSSVEVNVSTRPVRTTPGTVNVCTTIDFDGSKYDQGWGVMLETDETNNTDCIPIHVVQPHRDMVIDYGSIQVTPDPRDPAGLIRAGLDLEIAFDVHNRGNGAVRMDHVNRVLLGDSLTAAEADPNAEICTAVIDPNDGLPLLGGSTLPVRMGFGSGVTANHCKIPFRFPLGPKNLYIQLDRQNNVAEDDPNQVPDPAESNNLEVVPVIVSKPLDPQFRVQHQRDPASDQRVEIFGPATGTALVAAASVSGLTAYGFDLSWDPPHLMTLGDPSVAGGDPNGIKFRDFLQFKGLVHSCSVVSVDAAAGHVGVQCTTSNPTGTGRANWTEQSLPLLQATFTPFLPGGGTLSISNLWAEDADGQPFPDLRIADGTFFISGVPDLYVLNPVPASAAWPGVPFSISLDLLNDGFGQAVPPVRTELIVSRDAFNDPHDAFSPDLRACILSESVPLPGKTTVPRTIDGCLIRENIRPGLYTGFYQVQGNLDVSHRSSAVIPFPARILALRKSSKGRALDLRRHPATLSDPAGPVMVGARKFPARSMAYVKSAARNRAWVVRLRRPKNHRGKLFMDEIPVEPRAELETLREVRVTREVKDALSGADVDGDGEDELVLLLRSKRDGDRLDFRRIDFTAEFPSVCPSAAVSEAIDGRVLAAAGIQADADPEDEIAVLTEDGALTLFDVELTGNVRPAGPCLRTATAQTLFPPGTAVLTETASDPAFSLPGEEVVSLCALDLELDGPEEIASLHATEGKTQALRIYAPPAAPGGSALLLADDPEFGGAGGNGKIRWISCTR